MEFMKNDILDRRSSHSFFVFLKSFGLSKWCPAHSLVCKLLMVLLFECELSGIAIAAGSNALDRIDFGNAGSEQAHAFDSGSSSLPYAGIGALGQSFRQPLSNGVPGVASNGILSFTMTVDPVKQNYLTVRLWGSDNNGASITLQQAVYNLAPLDMGAVPPPFPNRFYYGTTPIALSYTQGKTSIQLVLYETQLSGTNGRPIYSAYTHSDPHFTPDGSDPTGSQLTLAGQLSTTSALTLSQVVSILQANRQTIYGSGGYYNSILARQVQPGTSGAPPEVIGLDMYNPVANFTGTTPDQWRDACGTHGHGPGYSSLPDEMLSVLTATYLLAPFTDANGNVVTGLDHYHDSTIIQRIVECLDGSSYLESSDGHCDGPGYDWNGLCSTPRGAGEDYAGLTTRGPGWSISLEGADTDCLGRTILALLNDATAAPIFKSYLSQSYDADLNGGSMLRANAYERMLNNQVGYTNSVFSVGTVSQGLFDVNATYINAVALAKLQALYPYNVTNTNFPAGTFYPGTTYTFPYPYVSSTLAINLLEQMTGAAASTPIMNNLYTTAGTNYAISAGGFGEAHGSLSGGYDGRYGTILPWITNNLATFAGYDPNASGTPLSLVKTQALRAVNGYLHFISPEENYNGLTDNFTLAQEDYITYRDPYGPNADCGTFNVGSGYPAADPSLGINSALELRGAYLEAVYGYTPPTGKGGGNCLLYLQALASYESVLRSLVNVNPATLTKLPGEPGAGNSAFIDPQTGATAIYYNGERLYMANDWRNNEFDNGVYGVASNVCIIHDTTSTVDQDAEVFMPHDSTTVQSDGNLSGGVAQPWVMRYGNWLIAGNPTSSSSTVTLPSGSGEAFDLVSSNRYGMGSTVTVPAGGSVALNMPVTSPTQAVANGTYALTNVSSRLLLDCPGGAPTNGLQIDQASPPSGVNSQWIFTYTGSGYYTVKNVASGLYLTSSTTQGAGSALVQEPADSWTDQSWQLIPSGDSYVLVNQASGLAVNDPGNSNSPGTGMIVWSQDAGANSAWKFQPMAAGQVFPNGNYTLTNLSSGLLADNIGSSQTSGQVIDQQVANGGTDQKWIFTYAGNGSYTIQNAASGLYLTPAGVVASFYNPYLEQQTYSAGNNWQLWQFIPSDAGYSIVNVGTGNIFNNQYSGPATTLAMNIWQSGATYTWQIQPATVTAPAAPTGVSVASGNGVATITWNASTGATAYDVLRSTTSGSGYTAIAYSVTGTSYADTSVTDGTTYYYEVTAVNSGGQSASSAQTAALPIAAPTNLAATGNTGSVALTWTTTTGATSFDVKRAVISGGPYTTVAADVTGTSYTDNTAINGTTYYYVVTALDGVGETSGPTLTNGGFETPSTGTYQYSPSGASWTFTAQSGANGSGISANGSAFTSSNPGAPQGAQVAFLQGTGAISQTVSGLTPGGVYTVTFYAAQRANANNGGQTWNVTMNGATIASYAPPQSATNYLSYSAQFTATASSETLAFLGTDTNGGDNTIFLDNVTVNGGNDESTVSNEATVIPGAVQSLANTGFETPSVGTYQYNPSGGSWTFTAQSGNSGSGLVANGSAFSNPNAPQGVQAAFLQSTSTISQTVSGLTTGTVYTVTFDAAQRSNGNNGGQTWNLTMNGTTIASFAPPQSATSYLPYSAQFTATASSETLAFVGTDTNGGDNTIFLDAVSINIFGTPVMTNTASTSGTVGSAVNYQLTASNLPTSYAASGLPGGLSVNTSTGLISGTPTTAGNFNATVSATNAKGTGYAILGFTINPVISAPVITSTTSANVSVGSAFSYQIAASNGPASYFATGLYSAGLTVNPTTGLISGTPNTAGTFTSTISATNSAGTGSATLTLTINPPVPAITSKTTASGTQGSAFTYQITASNSPTSYAASGLPSGVSVNTSTGYISGTPTVSGNFNATISATNAGGTGSAPCAITITTAAPVITSSSSAGCSLGGSLGYQITASNSPTSYAASGLPSGVSVNTSTGYISGTPTATGTYSASISATNSGGTGSATLTINVTAVVTVPNFGFETPSISTYQYNPSGASWTFAALSGSNGSGITANGSGFTSSNGNAPQGVQAAFLQGTASISQSISGLVTGTVYTVTFSAAQRVTSNNGGQTWKVTMNGTTLASYAPGESASAYATYAAQFTATAASETLAFVGTNTNGGDNTIFLDNVSIGQAPPPPTPLAATSGNAQTVVSWPAVTGAASYNVYRSTTSGSGYARVGTVTATTYTDTGLTNGTVYYYVATAVVASGAESIYSNQVTVLPGTLPSPWLTQSIAVTGGGGNYTSSGSSYSIEGTGTDVAGTSDQFQYIYQTGGTGCSIVAKVTAVQNTNAAAKVGVMIRETLNANATHASAILFPASGGGALLYRTTTGGTGGSTTVSGIAAPYWLKVTRSNSTFTAYRSPDGTTWTQIGAAQTITMASSVYIGIIDCSHSAGVWSSGTITNVTATP
jgi:fibronectin type 3 domain-containing protein